MLEELPDGIHSGLCKPGAKGVFFYFVAPSHEGGRLHFGDIMTSDMGGYWITAI